MRIISIEDVSFEETMLPKKLKDKAWEDHPAKKGMRSLVASIIDIPVYFSSFPERLKVVCVETNKTHDVMSKALETEDRDYVTEDDLTVGNELVWLKNKKRLTVRIALFPSRYCQKRNQQVHLAHITHQSTF